MTPKHIRISDAAKEELRAATQNLEGSPSL